MKIYSLAIISLLAFSAHADDKQTIEKLNQIQNYTKSMSTAVVDPACTNCKNKDELFKACSVDICKRGAIKEDFYSLKEKILNSAAKALDDPKNKKIYKQIKESVEKMLRSELDLMAENYKITKDRVINDKDPTDNNQLKLSTALRLISYNTESPQAPLYFVEQSKKIKDEIKRILGEKSRFFHGDDPDKYFIINYPGVPLQEAFKKDTKRASDLRDKIISSGFSKQYPVILNVLDNALREKIYTEAKAGKKLSSLDTKPYLNALDNIEIKLVAFQDEKFRKVVNELDPNEINKIMHSPTAKKSIEEVNLTLDKLKKDPKALQEYVDYISNQAFADYLNYPSTDKAKTLETMANDVKGQLDKKIFSNLSSESRKKLNESLKEWTFEVVDNKKYLKTTLDSFDFDTKSNERLNQDRQSRTDEMKINESGTMISIFSYSNSSAEKTKFITANIFSNSLISMKENFITPIDDVTFSSAKRIRMGWGSLKDPNGGKAIMAHELGHFLSSELRKNNLSETSSKQLVKVKDCLSQKHSKTKYVEEDFADLISAKIEGPSGNNQICAYSQPPKEILQIEDNDVHSTHFFRMLHIENVMRGLPDSCNDYLKTLPEKPNLENCWPETTAK